MEQAKNEKWMRFVAAVLIGIGILQVPYPGLEDTWSKILIEIAIGILAVAAIPFVWKVWPIAGEEPISMKRWALILGVMFAGDIVIKFRHAWFPHHPLAAEWVLVALFVLTGVVLLLLRK